MSRRVRHAARIIAWVLLLVGLSVQGSAAQEREPRSARVVFTELNDSGIEGTASLARRGDRTDVEIRTDGALGDHPTHIHQGSCDDLDPNPEFPLTNVQLRTAGLTGTSDTTVDVPLTDLLEEEHLILIHKSAKDIGTYYACGNIVAGRLSAAEHVGDDADDPLPRTGSGTDSGSDDLGTSPGGLLLMALAAFAAGICLALDRTRLVGRRGAVSPRRRP